MAHSPWQSKAGCRTQHIPLLGAEGTFPTFTERDLCLSCTRTLASHYCHYNCCITQYIQCHTTLQYLSLHIWHYIINTITSWCVTGHCVQCWTLVLGSSQALCGAGQFWDEDVTHSLQHNVFSTAQHLLPLEQDLFCTVQHVLSR